MKKKVGLLQIISMVCFCCILIVFLTGCGAEKHLPLPLEVLNGSAPIMEGSLTELDARGVVNGVYMPGNIQVYKPNFYPVNYTGDWYMVEAIRGHVFSITSDEPGARIDIVATLSRVTFDFLDPESYDDAGDVTFLIDDKPLGTFMLKRKNADGSNILDYQITSQKNTVATISMILNSGRVALAGYVLTFFDDKHFY